jgi:hypothetical protein
LALIAKYVHDAAYQIVDVYGWHGEADKAFDWIERAYAQHDVGIPNQSRPAAQVRAQRSALRGAGEEARACRGVTWRGTTR